MNRPIAGLVLLAYLCTPVSGYAAQPKIGATVDGGIFLYRQSVENYWDDWIAYPLMAKTKVPTSSQARATVTGEGKLNSFIGNLSINCENGKHFWESSAIGSEIFTTDNQADKIVPSPVIKNAIKLLCKAN
ncbi:hypothetical protein [Methylotenera sp.]|uniref:hypothetical protein n=1 Tax=Methylotenera sp. TaxID=2051956 RepID=UPI00273215AF|nr:hypothetical protein [Methylotenera sp.]MDP2071684.1 hypothetical protein [Methylotenera sp.]MDP3006774.1 hypothetical protein [Methylotenera sp.]